MPDAGHVRTDELIKSLENKLNDVYGEAHKSMQAKLAARSDKYAKMTEKKKQELSAGTISKKEYTTWVNNHKEILNNIKSLSDTLAADLTNTDKIAASIINGYTPSAYALNYNFGLYQVDSMHDLETSFSLYDKYTVEYLLGENPDLLPKAKINILEDMKWNKGHILSAITQGTLQGESIPAISERLKNAVGMSQRAAVRNGRTMMTGAQNAGRIDSYERAQNMGIDMRKEWVATLDNRTRHTHRQLDGEVINIDEKFSNGCEYPGDPKGVGYEVYNCRCTLIPVLAKYKRPERTTWNNGKKFDDWLEEQADPDVEIKSNWGDKKYSFVYNLMKNSDAPGHGADANAFFNALKQLGQDSGIGTPPKVWAAYMSGQLDAEDLKTFEDIIKKYLPKNAPDLSGNPFAGKTWSEMITDPKLAPGQPAMDYLLNNFDTSWDNHLEDWANGKIKDSKLDEFLLGKTTAKAADNIADTIAKEAQDQLDKLKIKAGNPMTKDEADTYKVNPLYNAADKTTTTNCQTASFAYECRRQGYDVIALPKDNKLSDIFDLQSKLGEDQANGWINKVTGSAPKKLAGYNMSAPAQTKKQIMDELENIVGKNGERYTLSVRWKSDGAHSINLDRDENGIIRIIDNQRGPLEKNTWTLEEYLDAKNVKNIRALYRVDDCVPNAEYFNKIVVDASKVKPNLPAKITGADPNYSKLYKIAKNKNETPSTYYKKWKYGIIDDPDMDDLLGIGKVATTKADDTIDVLGKKFTKADLINLDDDDLWDVLSNNYDETWLEKFDGPNFKKNVLDEIFDKTKSTPTPKPASKPVVNVGLDVDAFKDKSASAVWKELNANKAGGGKFWKDITDIGKSQNIKPAEAWKKYLAGELDADDVKKIETHLAKIYKKADNVTDDVVDDLANIKSTLSTDLADLIIDKKYDDVIDIIYKKQKSAKGSMNDYWKDYLAGKIEDKDIDDLLKKINPPAAKTQVKLPAWVTDKDFDLIDPYTGEILDKAKEFEKIKNMPITDLDDMAEKLTKDYYDLKLDDAKKILKDSGLNIPEKKTAAKTTAKTPTSTPSTAKATAATVDMDLLKTKKVSKVWNELKDQGGNAYSQFWKTVGDAGKDYGLEKKQSKVWDMYLNGKLKPEESKKIDDFLLKHYFNKADDVIDYSKYGGKEIYDILKNYHSYDDFVISPASEFDKISKAFGYDDDKIKAAIDEIEKSKAAKAASTVTKSDDLIKAEEKLKKAEEELKKLPNPTYSGIWKDNVTLADYEAKKGTIKAKKIWYEDEIDKLKNDPSYKSFWDDEKKKEIIKEYEKYLNDLDDFEVAGKEYAKYQKAVEKAKKEVQDLTPVGEAYTQARKDAALWPKTHAEYQKADKYYDPVARKLKLNRTSRETEGMWHYTAGSMPFNSPLAGFKGKRYTDFVGVNKVDINVGGYGERIRGLTSLVEKSHYDRDIWVNTAQDEITIESFLGIKPGTLANMTEAEAQQFVGVLNEIPQFISASIDKGGGSYVPGNMTINIYCPEGSEILYVLEDGNFKKVEHEMILQRGGTYKVTRIYKAKGLHNTNEWIVDLELHPEQGYDKFQQK